VATSTALTAVGDPAQTKAPAVMAENRQPDPSLSGQIDVTPEELAAWEVSIATPAQQAQIVADMQESFAGIATVKLGTEPHLTRPSSVGALELILAFGANATHFWITASYADMARGAIWVAVRACIGRGIPAWLCNAAGNQLSRWAQGWGSAANHGLWAAIYWAPPHFNGGRW
jgi:hypothetical protein